MQVNITQLQWGYFISNKYICFGDVQNPQKGWHQSQPIPSPAESTYFPWKTGRLVTVESSHVDGMPCGFPIFCSHLKNPTSVIEYHRVVLFTQRTGKHTETIESHISILSHPLGLSCFIYAHPFWTVMTGWCFQSERTCKSVGIIKFPIYGERKTCSKHPPDEG